MSGGPYGFQLMTQRWDEHSGGSDCVGCSGAPIVRATRVVVAADDRRAADRDRLLATLRTHLDADVVTTSSDCGGPCGFCCWAARDRAARNLLVYVADPSAPPSAAFASFAAEWLRQRRFDAIALLPKGAAPARVLPPEMERLHAIQWDGDVRETLPELLDALLLDDEERRVFISYSHHDGAATAERIFELLARARFDVFLDRFRLDPGIDFLMRIEDEIVDKAMVVVVETTRSARSQWVAHEINIASGKRLGLAAVNLDGARPFAAIAEQERFRGGDDDALLQFLLAQHRTQLLARREALRDSVWSALLHEGLTPERIRELPGGFHVRAPGGERLVSVAARPADLTRFRTADESAAGGSAYVVHPQPTLHRRKRDFAWLSDRTGVTEVDEGRIAHAAREIAS